MEGAARGGRGEAAGGAGLNAPLAELIAAIGTQLALRLVAERGGTRVYVPTPARLAEDGPLARVIGVEATAKLARLWPGVWLTVPRAMAYMRRMRDREIRARFKSETAAALAREFELTERQVYAIAAQGADDDAFDAQGKPTSQLALFG